MERGIVVIFGIIFTLVAAGIIVGGSIMCWRSTQYHVCSDWQYHGYPLYSCGNVYTDPIAPTQCNTTDLCYCRGPTLNYKCFAKPPGGVSVSLLIGGIALIVCGVIFIGCVIVMVIIISRNSW